VVLDTDVWSALFASARTRHPDADSWRALLLGRTVVIAEQTRAEVIGGLLSAGLGPTRAQRTLDQLANTQTVPVDNDLARVCGELYAACRAIGHALHAKDHTGDRWVAATAIHTGLPLLANDGIYRGVPGLVRLSADQDGR
jgi:predicted nucleic acid-binding protein